MDYFFPDFDLTTRLVMLDELSKDLENGLFYEPESMTYLGVLTYKSLLKRTFTDKDLGFLQQRLTADFFKSYASSGKKVSQNISKTVSYNDFNRYYTRAILARAIADKRQLVVYRAKSSLNERAESKAKLHSILSDSSQQRGLLSLLRDYRKLFKVKTQHTLLSPNSGLSLRFLS